ncbi:MAG: bifunctional riboflavin kinase/FAD synthetase [Myxococcales bacterium]|nr:bifunctional riboflavin kinase/FAD synthetase [Myxococcales bacterium]
MRIYWGRDAFTADPARPGGAVVAIGNFDGVHRGHQALLARAHDVAARTSGRACGVLTFDPHPARHFAPQLAPPMIMPLAARLETLASAGAGFALVQTFDAAFAHTTPEAFVFDHLHAELGVSHVVVGYDFAFGKGRQGNASKLVAWASQVGIGVDVLEPVTVEGIVCSSTKVREFVLEGRVEGAALLLGRPYALEGQVVHGAARGRNLGYPTANVAADTELLPRAGIYAAWATEAPPVSSAAAEVFPSGEAPAWPAAVSVGTNPTFNVQGALSIEAHLIDYSGDLYGKRLRLSFVARLRDELRFDNVEALVRQIAADVTQARDRLLPPSSLGNP